MGGLDLDVGAVCEGDEAGGVGLGEEVGEEGGCGAHCCGWSLVVEGEGEDGGRWKGEKREGKRKLDEVRQTGGLC